MPAPPLHTPFKAEHTGICDSSMSKLLDIDASRSNAIATLVAATAQMVVRSGTTRLDEEKNLHIPVTPLRDVVIGQHRLCPNTASDFGQFLDQPCIRGSTAVLIGPRHVLVAAHTLILSDLIQHFFVFGRTVDAAHVGHGDKEVVIQQGKYHKAKQLLAYVNTDQVDWAVVELFKDVDAAPLPVGRWNPSASALCLGHPLGLPLKQAPVMPTGAALPPTYRIAIDNGSGGSGSPIIQNGAVVGVLRGQAGVDPAMLTQYEGEPCLDPALCGCAVAQPFTPSMHFASALPQIFGW